MGLLWLLVALPIIEIALFIQIGGLIGVWAVLGLVILAAVLGMAVIRSQGTHAWLEAQRSLSQLRDPSRPLAHGMMLMIAGLLLIVPGFFTDGIALLLLIRPVRDLILRRAAIRTRVQTVHMRRESHRPPYADGVIDADFVVEDETPDRRPRPPLDLPEDLAPDGPSPRRGGSGWTRH